jgi:NAD dependent epimerase/dehydratase family enzyme
MGRDLVVEVQFLHDLAKGWEDQAATLYAAQMEVVGQQVPTIWGSAGALNSAIDKLNAFSVDLSNLMGDGQWRFRQVADKLRGVARQYVISEAANADAARKLEEVLNG